MNTTNPVVRRMFRHQEACPPGTRVIRRGEQTICLSPSPQALGDASTTPPAACGVSDFLNDRAHNDAAVFTHATSLAAFAGILALGGGIAGLLLAGRPVSGAALGVLAGAGVTLYQYEQWKAQGGTSNTPGACSG